METVILLFLLASLDKNASLQTSLRNVLGFYRENRDFLAALLQQTGSTQPSPVPPPAGHADSSPAEKPHEKESRTGIGSLDILDEYLKRCAI